MKKHEEKINKNQKMLKTDENEKLGNTKKNEEHVKNDEKLMKERKNK